MDAPHPLGPKLGQFVHIGSMLNSSLEFTSYEDSSTGDGWYVSMAALSGCILLVERGAITSEWCKYNSSLAIGWPMCCKCTRICKI